MKKWMNSLIAAYLRKKSVGGSFPRPYIFPLSSWVLRLVPLFHPWKQMPPRSLPGVLTGIWCRSVSWLPPCRGGRAEGSGRRPAVVDESSGKRQAAISEPNATRSASSPWVQCPGLQSAPSERVPARGREPGQKSAAPQSFLSPRGQEACPGRRAKPAILEKL